MTYVDKVGIDVFGLRILTDLTESNASVRGWNYRLMVGHITSSLLTGEDITIPILLNRSSRCVLNANVVHRHALQLCISRWTC